MHMPQDTTLAPPAPLGATQLLSYRDVPAYCEQQKYESRNMSAEKEKCSWIKTKLSSLEQLDKSNLHLKIESCLYVKPNEDSAARFLHGWF